MKGVWRRARVWGAAAALLLSSAAPSLAQAAFLDACFAVAPDPIPARAPVTLDGGCSRSNLGGRVTSYTWNFGDGSAAAGERVEHTYAVGGQYRVGLTVRDNLGHTATVARILTVIDTILPMEDGFDRAAGTVVTGWTPFSGQWLITPDGRLRGRSAGESHIYAGSPAGVIAGDVTIEFDIEFLSTPLDGEGRYAGVFFFAQEPVSRWSTTAYSVAWTDRSSVGGLGLHRWSGGRSETLAVSRDVAPRLDDPPRAWKITVEGPQIRVYGDGALILDVRDDRVPRRGHVGLWTHSNGQDVLFDNFRARAGAERSASERIVPCAEPDVEVAFVDRVVSLDAGCTEIPDGVEVAAYSWDFGDGTTGSERVVEHAYDSPGEYIVQLTIEADDGATVTTSLALTVVFAAELPYSEMFDLPAGRRIDGWKVLSGDWRITNDERLEVSTSISEAYVWIGDPPIWFDGDLTMEFEVEFEGHTPPADDIGRHAGVFFYAKEPTTRSSNEAYDVWWIDRQQDAGLGLHKWPLRFLSPGTLDRLGAPPSTWRIEVNGPTIRVFGDDQLLIEADDETRRGGYIGFWAYSNNQKVRFDNLCILQGPYQGRPDCSAPPPPPPPEAPRFVRGDTNGDAARDITDGVVVLLYLFSGGVAGCHDAMDANDDGQLNIADGIFVLNFLFGGGEDPPAPSMDCGEDPTEDDLSCEQSESCA